MAFTQSIETLRQQIIAERAEFAKIIDPMEERLKEMEEEEIAMKLNDNQRGIICTKVRSAGMRNQYGKHHHKHDGTMIQQQQCFDFAIQPDTNEAGRLTVILQDSYGTDGHYREVFIHLFPNEAERPERGYNPATRHIDADIELPCLFFYTHEGCEYELTEENRASVDRNFDRFAPLVWNHLQLLSEKREHFPFIY